MWNWRYVYLFFLISYRNAPKSFDGTRLRVIQFQLKNTRKTLLSFQASETYRTNCLSSLNECWFYLKSYSELLSKNRRDKSWRQQAHIWTRNVFHMDSFFFLVQVFPKWKKCMFIFMEKTVEWSVKECTAVANCEPR